VARITVEDCLEKVPNRFTLILTAAERAKQLLTGSPSLLEDDRANKEIVTALREVAAGLVAPDLSDFDENELLHLARAEEELAISLITTANQEVLDAAGPGPTIEFKDLPPEADAELPPEA
jgi:DNA-directed RNA polymerase subunit omega